MEKRIPPRWDCGPDADEYAGDLGEQQQADEEFDHSGSSRHADGPMHYAGYAALEGWKEQW